MTRGGYLLALALFGACALLGAVGAAPAPHELGLVETRSCAEWLDAPETGHFRLTGCEVDLRHPEPDYSSFGPRDRVHLQVPGTAARTPLSDSPLLWAVDDPQLRALTGRVGSSQADSPERRRTLERYRHEVVTRRDVVGAIDEIGGGRYELAADKRSSLWRASAIVLFLFGLLGLVLLVPSQRRWKRRERALGAEGTQPLRF